MAAPYSNALHEDARLWAIRVRDPQFEDWDAFTSWLEADPSHARAYDAACDIDDAVADLFATPAAPEIVEQAENRPRRRWWIGTAGAVAAVLAITVGYSTLDRGAPARVFATAPGEQHMIALADGSSIVLNGDTRVVLDDDTPRLASLERGEALFRVRHNDEAPFTVQIGQDRLVDVGTVFDVTRDGGTTRVSVSDGAVVYNPDAQAVRLDAGKALHITADRVTLSDIAPEAVGSWQTGTLIFADTPMAEVADALTRSTGASIELAPGFGDGRFTGTLTLGKDKAQALPRIAPLLGATVQRRNGGWILMPSDRAQP